MRSSSWALVALTPARPVPGASPPPSARDRRGRRVRAARPSNDVAAPGAVEAQRPRCRDAVSSPLTHVRTVGTRACCGASRSSACESTSATARGGRGTAAPVILVDANVLLYAYQPRVRVARAASGPGSMRGCGSGRQRRPDLAVGDGPRLHPNQRESTGSSNSTFLGGTATAGRASRSRLERPAKVRIEALDGGVHIEILRQLHAHARGHGPLAIDACPRALAIRTGRCSHPQTATSTRPDAQGRRQPGGLRVQRR